MKLSIPHSKAFFLSKIKEILKLLNCGMFIAA